MPRHILLLTLVLWGHLRPECNLAVNLVRRYPDLTVSVLVDADFQSNAADEIKRIASDGDMDILPRVRVIAASQLLEAWVARPGTSWQQDPRERRLPTVEVTQAMVKVAESIMQDEPFTDDNGGVWDSVHQKPSLIIADMFMGDVAMPLKEKYKRPIYMFWATSAFSFTRYYAPVTHGGQAVGYVEECEAIAADERRAKGRSFGEIAKQVNAFSGRYPDNIVRVRGMKPFYEWEDQAQDRWSNGMYWLLAGIYPFIEKTDGLILPSVVDLDPEGIEGVKDWYSVGRARPVLCLGPQLPSSYLNARIRAASEVSTALGNEVQISYLHPKEHGNKQIDPSIAFLDAAMAKYGANSVLYITFGSFMFPSPTHVQYLFEVLLELESPIPFLFAGASPVLSLSEDLKQKIEKSGRGLMVNWAPQQSILLHPATGWALSHCGHGGLSEAFSQGVPIIAWPIACDQEHNARWMTEVLDTAFELLQVRIGPGKGKTYRGGPEGTEIVGTEEAIKGEMKEVLSMCAGDEGRRKREKAAEIKQIIQDARKSGGQLDHHYELLGRVIL
ncbi:glycosyltransferase family 1 protein [Calocera viscosa TUFC12733]|uniref:Glycosyltransferase family 1 protein n=1 Tax=Calocera viscosa (strain TUFC12733) TaxID=1330018 RepID=A0A167GNL1_CALVF|nr:glycosyltransferase family 1 protein [Calocera viscosa TUFC12733]